MLTCSLSARPIPSRVGLGPGVVLARQGSIGAQGTQPRAGEAVEAGSTQSGCGLGERGRRSAQVEGDGKPEQWATGQDLGWRDTRLELGYARSV